MYLTGTRIDVLSMYQYRFSEPYQYRYTELVLVQVY